YLDGFTQLPATVAFGVPPGWRVATGLSPTTSDSTTFTAPNYDVLIDSPMLVGEFLSYTFTAAGTSHRAVGDLGVGRAAAPADFARRTTRSIENFQNDAARMVISPERAYWTTWDSPAVNQGTYISYYLQGELLGFLLDLAIRDSTDNARSLDDVMRFLMRHYSGDYGFTRDQLVEAVRSATGCNFEAFWRLHVSGTSDIPWNDYLKAAGWRLALTRTPAVDARIGSIPPAVPGGRWRAVAPLGAAWLAGLRTGDELVRINR